MVEKNIQHASSAYELAADFTGKVVEGAPIEVAGYEKPVWVSLPREDTAASAREVGRVGDPSQAAIAGVEAADIYGLTVLRENIADQQENWTRFVVISGLEIELDPRIPAKTSLVFTTPHREGALAHCLNLLAEHGVNLTKLESRPVQKRPWEYLFYVDIEGSLLTDGAALAIAELRRECPYLRVLGSYPARTTAAGAVDRYSENRD